MELLGSVQEIVAAAVIALVTSTVTFIAKFVKSNKARIVEFKKSNGGSKSTNAIRVYNVRSADSRNDKKH